VWVVGDASEALGNLPPRATPSDSIPLFLSLYLDGPPRSCRSARRMRIPQEKRARWKSSWPPAHPRFHRSPAPARRMTAVPGARQSRRGERRCPGAGEDVLRSRRVINHDTPQRSSRDAGVSSGDGAERRRELTSASHWMTPAMAGGCSVRTPSAGIAPWREPGNLATIHPGTNAPTRR
jgi:hypothetical protein